MKTFCEYCGTQLEEGQLCNCPEARAARPAASPAPAQAGVRMTFCEYCGKRIPVGTDCDCPEARVACGPGVPASTHTSSVDTFCEFCGMRVPAGMMCGCPEARATVTTGADQFQAIASATRKIASNLGREAKSSLGAILKNPAEMAASHVFSMQLSVVLIVIEIFSKTWFVDRLIKGFIYGVMGTMIKAMGSSSVSYQAEMKAGLSLIKYFETKHYFFLFLIMAGQTLLVTMFIFLLPKLMKNTSLRISQEGAFSTVAFSSIPWTAATLISSIVMSVFSFSALSAYIMFAICGAALMLSSSLLNIGLKKFIPSDKQRLTLTAVCYGLQLMLVMLAIFSLVPDRLIEALGKYM